jgi:hypothetical protein
MMIKRKSPKFIAYFLLVMILAGFAACAKPEEETVKEAPTTSEEIKPPAELPVVNETAKLPEPKNSEIQSSIKRLYKDSLIVEETRFLTGDFNGDTYQDLAVIVKPMPGKLEDINSEVANWILEDPRKILLPDPTKAVQPLPPKPEPVVVNPGDVLIAVLHGYGQEGWRNNEASQTYLLKNAAGNNMKSQAGTEFLKEMKGLKNPPFLRGDIIRQTLDGKPGFLYYTGAKYVWRQLDS